MQSKLDELFVSLIIFLSCNSLFPQSRFFFSSLYVQALHLPCLSKVILGLVDILRQDLHQKILPIVFDIDYCYIILNSKRYTIFYFKIIKRMDILKLINILNNSEFKKTTLGGCIFFKKGENLCLKVEKT